MKKEDEYLNLETKTITGTKIVLLEILSGNSNIKDVDFLVFVKGNGYKCMVKSIDIIKPETTDKKIQKHLDSIVFADEKTQNSKLRNSV